MMTFSGYIITKYGYLYKYYMSRVQGQKISALISFGYVLS